MIKTYFYQPGVLLAFVMTGLLSGMVSTLSAQSILGGGNGDPSAVLDLQSNNKGLLISRMTSAQRSAIANPEEGLMIFNTTLGCIEVNIGSSANPDWNCLLAAGKVTVLDCAGVVRTGAVLAGSAASGVSFAIPYTGGNGGSYGNQAVASTGVTGLTASLLAGELASGSGSLTYTISGTPSGAGTASFAISVAGQSCTISLSVIDLVNTANGGGSLAGLSCFDIARGNDNTNSCGTLSSRQPQQADFSNAATHTLTYTFTPIGTVSNMRVLFLNTNGTVITAISGSNSGNNITGPQTITVNYNTNLNTLAAGLTNSNALTADIYVLYNNSANNSGTDQKLKLTVQVKDCFCCGAYVASGVWKQFMCHNLGATESANPFSPSWELNGQYYQWGRNPTCFARDGVDGTNTCTSPVYGAAAPWGSTTSNDNAGVIADWSTVTAPTGAWSPTTKTVNDPCPVGYRVPSRVQWNGVINTTFNTRTSVGTWTAGTTNYNSGWQFGSALYLPAAGSRLSLGGELSNRNSFGRYWSSTEDSPLSYGLNLVSSSGSVATTSYGRLQGYSVRCIAE